MLVIRLTHNVMTGLIMLAGVTSACIAQEQASPSGDPVVREQALVKNNVWHKARLRGVSFRAIGQEPGWLLEIADGKEILLTRNYGEIKTSYPYVKPQVDRESRQTLFQLDREVKIVIEGKPCTDTMSGESFATTVTISLPDASLSGCGRALH